MIQMQIRSYSQYLYTEYTYHTKSVYTYKCQIYENGFHCKDQLASTPPNNVNSSNSLNKNNPEIFQQIYNTYFHNSVNTCNQNYSIDVNTNAFDCLRQTPDSSNLLYYIH
ncbi:unnamed protein product [Cuscuta epithymum]|uniref:Uncharacterized protein n=1 Tax=Cuscuta epithymum TaxID=186058 RepID=A0AAV0CGG1_9ASTE|nr:unnamed protein product [Cuscuta epithymum]